MPKGYQFWLPKFWLPNLVLYKTDKGAGLKICVVWTFSSNIFTKAFTTRVGVNSIPELELQLNSNSNSGIGIGIGIEIGGIENGIGIENPGIGIGIGIENRN